MERPKGVTVLAYVYMVAALIEALSTLITLIPSPTLPHPLQLPGLPRMLARSLGVIIIGVTLGIGLLKMKNWCRWLAIILNVLNLARLVFIPREVAEFAALIPPKFAAYSTSVVVIRAGLIALFCVWVIWYLTRPHVKSAFQSV
jgi:hypothetical protein